MLADMLMDAYDTDFSGAFDVDEFFEMMQRVPGRFSRDQVVYEMLSAGSCKRCRIHGVDFNEDGAVCMHRSHFYSWVRAFFGGHSDEKFEEIMQGMLDNAPKADE